MDVIKEIDVKNIKIYYYKRFSSSDILIMGAASGVSYFIFIPFSYMMRCAIWYHLYNLKIVKNIN